MSQQFLNLPPPISGNGAGAAVAVPEASPHKTLVVTGTFTGQKILVELSRDGLAWGKAYLFDRQGEPVRAVTFSAPFVRASIARDGEHSGTPVITLGIDTVAVGSYNAADLPLDGTPVDLSLFENKHKTFIVAGATAQNLGAKVVVYVSGDGVKYVPLFVGEGNSPPFLFDGFIKFVRVLPAGPPDVPRQGDVTGMSVAVVTEPFDCVAPAPPVGDCNTETLPLAGVFPDAWVAGPALATVRTFLLAAVTKRPAGFRALFLDGRSSPGGLFDKTVDGYAWDGVTLSKDVAIATPTSGDGTDYEMSTAVTRSDCIVTVPQASYNTGSDEDPPIVLHERQAKLYDPTTNLWTLTASPPAEPRAIGGAGLDTRNSAVLSKAVPSAEDGEGVVVIPQHLENASPTADIVVQIAGVLEYLDAPIAAPIPDYPAFAGSACTALADGRVLISGGGGVGTAIKKTVIYSPTANSWVYTGDMNTARKGHALITLDDGRVVAIGGRNAGSVPIASCEVYTPGTGLWAAIGDLPTPLVDFAAVKLPDGRPFVMGGRDGLASTTGATALLATGPLTWSLGPVLNTPRNSANAVVMPSTVQYTVVIAGGLDSGGAAISSVEYLVLDPTPMAVANVVWNS